MCKTLSESKPKHNIIEWIAHSFALPHHSLSLFVGVVVIVVAVSLSICLFKCTEAVTQYLMFYLILSCSMIIVWLYLYTAFQVEMHSAISAPRTLEDLNSMPNKPSPSDVLCSVAPHYSYVPLCVLRWYNAKNPSWSVSLEEVMWIDSFWTSCASHTHSKMFNNLWYIPRGCMLYLHMCTFIMQISITQKMYMGGHGIGS